MKHYICVEEHEITYVCAAYRAPEKGALKGTIVVQAAESVAASRDVSGVIMDLSERHHLEGKRVILVLGRDISCIQVNLPKAGERALRRMASYELAAAGKCSPDSPAAVDIQRIGGERRIMAMVYYMEKARLDAYVKAMELAGMLYAGPLLMPDCMAAAYIMCKSRASIVIDVEKESLGLYGVSGGHCLAWRNSPLKSVRFLEMDARELLLEEIAEQAELVRGQMEQSGKCCPERIVLVGNCPLSMDEAGAFLENRLKLPCTGGEFCISMEHEGKEPVEEPQVSAGTLAAVVSGSRTKGSPLRLRSGRDAEGVGAIQGIRGAVSRGCALFLLVNLLAAAGIVSHVAILRHQASRAVSELQEAMEDPDYKERYKKLSSMDSKMAGEAARRTAELVVMEEFKGMLGMEEFEPFTSSMEPGMQVESMVYDKDEDVLQMVISMSSSAQVPAYVERVKAAGGFGRVSHSFWKKEEDGLKERIYVSVSAALKEGGQDETQ